MIISIIIVIIVFTILMVRFLSATKTYYTIFENVKGLSVNDPVIIEGLKVGNVKLIDFLMDGSNNLIVKIKIKSDINIPDKSYAEILPLNHPEFDKSLNIKFVSSGGYFEDGDTINLRKNLASVDSLIELSNKAKEELVETLKAETENKQKIKETQKDIPSKKEEISKNENNAVKSEVVKKETPKPAVKEKVTKQDKVVFKLQILVSKEKIPFTDSRFKNSKNIDYYEEKGLYKYVLGNEDSFDKIKELSQKVKASSFPDAFIVAFKNNKRISIEEARGLLEK